MTSEASTHAYSEAVECTPEWLCSQCGQEMTLFLHWEQKLHDDLHSLCFCPSCQPQHLQKMEFFADLIDRLASIPKIVLLTIFLIVIVSTVVVTLGTLPDNKVYAFFLICLISGCLAYMNQEVIWPGLKSLNRFTLVGFCSMALLLYFLMH